MCDPRDLGVALTEDISGGLLAWEPDLYLYDSYAGGVGLSAPLFRLSDRLLSQTRELIEGCGCEGGMSGVRRAGGGDRRAWERSGAGNRQNPDEVTRSLRRFCR